MPELTGFPDGTVALLLSSRTATGVFREAAALAGFVRGDPQTTPAQVSKVLAATRSPQPWRALVRVRDRDGLLAALDALAAGDETRDVPGASIAVGQAQARTIAMVFPGQGGQYPGMGQDLYGVSTAYRATVDRLDRRFAREGLPVREYLIDAVCAAAVQPALFVHMLALQAVWQEWGVMPDMVVGHSQGELAAACVAGLFAEEDAVRVVARRTQLSRQIATTGRYAMLIVGCDRDSIERKLPGLTGWAEVCVVNSPSLHVVTGDADAVTELEAILGAEDCFVRRIEVDFPSHTHLMDTVREPFEETLSPQPFCEARIPCIGSTLGAPIPSGSSQRAYWFANLRHRVRFDLAVRCALDQGASSFLEVSSHPALLTAIVETAAAAGRPDIRVGNCGQRETPTPVGFADRLAEVLVTHRDITIARPERAVVTPLRFPSVAWEPDVHWAPSEPGMATPGRIGMVPQCLGERWEALGAYALPEPRRVLLLPGAEHWLDPLTQEASRFGASIVTDEAAVGVVMLDPALWAGRETSSALSLVHTLLTQLQGVPVSDLLVVTTGAEDRSPYEGATPDPIAAAAAAMVRCLASDLAPVRLRHLDLDPAQEPADSARQVMTAAHIVGEPHLAVLGAALHARRLIPEESATRHPDFTEAVVLGGTGVVGREVCRRLAEQGCTRVVVVSRRAPSSLTAAALQAITHATGAEVVHRACDITDRAAVGELAAALSPAPRLVVHCAVDYDAVTDIDWAAAIAPKSGAVAVVREYLVRPEDRFLVFSSLSAGIGAHGHAAYAATNRVLEVTALADAGNTTVIRWGLWPHFGHTGAVGDRLQEIETAGLRQMDPAAAVAAALSAPTGLVGIAAADWERIAEAFSLIGAGVLFRHLLTAPQPVPAASPEEASVPAEPPIPAEPPATERTETVGLAEQVERVVREALGYASGEELDFSRSLVSLGIDSMQALTIQRELARIPVNAGTSADILRGASLGDLIHTATKEQP